jgi:hypothetical protein
MVGPYGEGLCGCHDGWVLGFEAGRPGGQQGVCRKETPREKETREKAAREGVVSRRRRQIFDNLPVNDETAFSRATLLNCYVDEAGQCRQTWNLGLKKRIQFHQTLLDWLASFEKADDALCPLEDGDGVEDKTA